MKLIPSGIHLAPEIRLFLRVWKSTSSASRHQQGRRLRFYSKRRSDSDHNRDTSSVRSILQAGKEKVTHSYDGEDNRILLSRARADLSFSFLCLSLWDALVSRYTECIARQTAPTSSLSGFL